MATTPDNQPPENRVFDQDAADDSRNQVPEKAVDLPLVIGDREPDGTDHELAEGEEVTITPPIRRRPVRRFLRGAAVGAATLAGAAGVAVLATRGLEQESAQSADAAKKINAARSTSGEKLEPLGDEDTSTQSQDTDDSFKTNDGHRVTVTRPDVLKGEAAIPVVGEQTVSSKDEFFTNSDADYYGTIVTLDGYGNRAQEEGVAKAIPVLGEDIRSRFAPTEEETGIKRDSGVGLRDKPFENPDNSPPPGMGS